MGREVREEGRAQQEHEAQSGILDAGFDGQGALVRLRKPEDGGDVVADGQGQEVVDQHDQEDVFDALQEGVHVAGEGQDDHRDEEGDGDVLEGLLEEIRHLREIPGGQDARRERNAQQDEDGPEHVHQRDGKGRDVGMDRGEMQVGVAPEPEIERGHHDGEGRGDGGEAHGKLDIGLGQGRHEIGDVPAGAGCHQDHAQAHHRGDPPADEDGEQAGEGRQQDELARGAQDDGFGLLEHVHERARLDAQRDAVHDEGKYDIDGVHPTGVQGYLDLVDGGCGFR